MLVHMVIGSIICCYVAKALKLVIRQERPTKENHRKKSYGMPSTHSAAVLYYGIYLTHILLYNYGPDAGAGAGAEPGPSVKGWCLLISVLLICSMAALSRAFNGYHTFAQVYAGMFLGTAFAAMWWSIRLSLYPYIDPIAEVLQLLLSFDFGINPTRQEL
ncbi:hypothetical protein GGF40_002517 [Coemansia sp. RSA 1286]|nr:hypothetical protein GGF40_002517 [Coemansia sp. RSA 1286]